MAKVLKDNYSGTPQYKALANTPLGNELSRGLSLPSISFSDITSSRSGNDTSQSVESDNDDIIGDITSPYGQL